MQNAGAKAAGTGLNQSNAILKISLSQAAAVSTERNASGRVDVVTVNANPAVINSNGSSAPIYQQRVSQKEHQLSSNMLQVQPTTEVS